MLHLTGRAIMAHALTLDLDPGLRALLIERIDALVTEYGDLTDHTEFLVVELHDLEADIVQAIGISPLVEPIDGWRFGEVEFYPFWDWLIRREGWFEMTITFGSSFGYHLIIEDDDLIESPLLRLCRYYTASHRGHKVAN